MVFTNHREFFDAGVNQKTFKATYASGCQFSNLFEIVGNQASPGRPIHVALALRRPSLCFQRL